MATSAASSSNRGRKRTKTFTGCWTCRSRKVKCDEARPRCNVCRKKGVHCEGYETRLQWLPPDTTALPIETTHSLVEAPEHSVRISSQRRHMPAKPPCHVLSWRQIEDVLGAIDAWEPTQDLASCGEISLNIHNFGLFRLDPDEHVVVGSGEAGVGTIHDQVCAREKSDAREQTYVQNQILVTYGRINVHALSPDNADIVSDAHASYPLSTEYAATAAYDPLSAPLNRFGWVTNNSPQSEAGNESLASIAGQADSTSCVSWESTDDQRPEQTSGPRSDAASPPPQIDSSKSTSTILPARNLIPKPSLRFQERYLIHHYMHHVVNLFCVIDNAKSPWKTIHLPRVMQCEGELGIQGWTSTIRSALRNALLSISAFFLGNEHQSHQRNVEAQKWFRVAFKYRGDAIGLLKRSVETDLYSQPHPKYKEFLATMLSMITINVMSGDTVTCGLHLDGADQLIRYTLRRKKKFSSKAQALHRIYFYLRVIYGSTAIREHSDMAWCVSPLLAQSTSAGQVPVEHGPFDEDEQDSGPSSIPINSRQTEDATEVDMASYECIYGIPLALLKMLKETIDLINKVELAKSESASWDQTLSDSCDELEQTILEWPTKSSQYQRRSASIRPDVDIIWHQTRAFYNALVIYFCQNVRSLNYRYLRQYVETVLEEIEAIERIKAKTKILAAPLFWPAFIAAAEAFDQHYQDRFRAWYADVEKYSIVAMRTGVAVIHMVWEEGPRTSSNQRSSWRRIIQETGATLMLT